MKSASLAMTAWLSFAFIAPGAQAQTQKQTPRPSLLVAAESNSMIWNGVAVAGGNIFVSGPRWTGSKGPALARLDAKGQPKPYPDAGWNAWKPGDDPRNVFVNINAIHRDPSGDLWVVDTGAPDFGGNPLPGGAKVVRISLKTHRVSRIYPFGPEAAQEGSYIDDIRFNGRHAYLTDAGKPGLVVLDLETGRTRRVLDGVPATAARADRPIVLGGQTVKAPDGSNLKVNADPLELSPDGRWLYFAPLSGPWSRIETRWLDDSNLTPEALAAHVEPWADLPPVGGTAMDGNGDLYFTNLAQDSLQKRTPDGRIETVLQDPRLHWVDAPVIDEQGFIWLPVPQMDRVGLFNQGQSKTVWPVSLYRLRIR
ncbi:major royal jelly family protein [Archangium lipolyticum]|uniref:major royal jelly family protein n=1 Tax=Archangium lipolyticum TaxID=2970465 RepID=UPI002149E177|nr:major royal jelly family protein [Archangium lipolyticum]